MGLGASVEPLSRFGWMGVDLFFALSGYLIGSQWLGRAPSPGALPGFYARRAWRILPAFAVVLATYEFVPALREAPNLMPWWQYVTFTENLFITFDVPRAFTHVWSLCVEEHFYLLFPVLSLVLLRRWPRGAGPLLVALVLGGMALRSWLWTSRVSVAAEPEIAFYEQLYYPTWCRLDGLLVGIAAAVVKVHRPAWFAALQRWRGWLGGVALGSGALAAWLFDPSPTWAAVTFGFPLLALAMGAVVVAATTWRREVPGAAPLAAGAYSLYLSHKLAFAAARDRLQPALQLGSVATWVVAFALAGLVGAALYLGVERPFLRRREADVNPAGAAPAR